MSRRSLLVKLLAFGVGCCCRRHSYAEFSRTRKTGESLILDPDGFLSDSELSKRLMHAFSRGVRRFTVSRNLNISTSLEIPSGVELVFLGVIFNLSSGAALVMQRANLSIVYFRSIVGDGATEKQTGIFIEDSCDCKIVGDSISNTLNKGVDLTSTSNGKCERNFIKIREITGAHSADGAAISIFGSGSQHNCVEGGIYKDNRIGITINGGRCNEILSVKCNANTEAGIMLDGIISQTGDGASFNRLQSIECNGNGLHDYRYGGLYLGNGASFNTVLSLLAHENGGAGCRISGGDGFNLRGNIFTDLRLIGNRGGGLISSHSPEMSISNVKASGNASHGIHVFNCDMTSISGNASNNQGDGLLVQSGNVKVTKFMAIGNKGVGIHVAYGGHVKPSIVLRETGANGNVRGNYLTPAGCIS